jgi:hypothetical protein
MSVEPFVSNNACRSDGDIAINSSADQILSIAKLYPTPLTANPGRRSNAVLAHTIPTTADQSNVRCAHSYLLSDSQRQRPDPCQTNQLRW